MGKLIVWHDCCYNLSDSSVDNFICWNGIFFVLRASAVHYIKMGEKYIEVNSKGKLLDVLKDKKKELKKYISSANLDFGDAKEQAILKTVAYYDQISN